LLTGAQDLTETMGWEEKIIRPARQRELFIQLSAEEKNNCRPSAGKANDAHR